MTNNKKKTNQKTELKSYPFVSVCTPTFNRRPFWPFIIKCFENQTYPKDRIEWIIIDDGTDKVEDLFVNIPQVKYFKYDTQMVLGKKRNIANKKCKGEIILYMDDDDYYPPERISHAVDVLQKNPNVLCVGSSEMYIYFKHIKKMYQFGPYGPNHATAASFAFRKELLQITKYNDEAALAEEKDFLQNYTIPFAQLDPLKTILVFSHIHNSFDKKKLLEMKDCPFIKESNKKVDQFIKDAYIKKFFLEDIDEILKNYDKGTPENKPEVLKQMAEITQKREKLQELQKEQQDRYKELIQKSNSNNSNNSNDKAIEMSLILNELLLENNQLKEKVKYLEQKLKEKINQNKLEGETFNVRIVK